jgi:hypothetical protein
VNAHVDTGNDMIEFEDSHYMIIRDGSDLMNWSRNLQYSFSRTAGSCQLTILMMHAERLWKTTSKEWNARYIIAQARYGTVKRLGPEVHAICH